MKIGFLMVVLVAYVSADCECLKCSKHLQGVDILGPAGNPVKVIFRRPKPAGCGCSCSCGCASNDPERPEAVEECAKAGPPGSVYSAMIQVPLPKIPKPKRLLTNLKYRTDTILVPQPTKDVAPTINPASITTEDILNWLRNLQLAHQLAVENGQPPTSPPVTVETCPCDCQECKGNTPSEIMNRNSGQERPQCPHYASHTSKRSVTLKNSQNFDKLSKLSNLHSSLHSSRSKRDLGKHGYNFLMRMLPQSVREPLHHSVQGSNYLKQSQPRPSFKQKIDGTKNLYDQHNILNHYVPYRRSTSVNQPDKNFFGQKSSNYFQQPKHVKHSLFNPELDYMNELRSKSKYYLPERQGTVRKPKFSSPNQKNPLESQKYSWLDNKSTQNLLFGKTKSSTNNRVGVFDTAETLTDNKYQTLVQKYGSQSPPKIVERLEEKESANEKTLLRKLKKLNNNYFTSNLEDQANIFMQKLLKPEEPNHRHKRSIEKLPREEISRKKRTIILGSDELDLPAHYEVEMVSAEDESGEVPPVEFESSEEFEPEAPVVGVKPFKRKLAPSRFYRPSLPSLQQKPEILLGKNVIQKAVREELDAYHKKVANEQKIKEMKENLQRKKRQPFGIPQNPIFALLTAPMTFLKHFSDLNRGVNPVMMTLPKLVYATKKVFKDLGKNFQRNCLDLASNVIGDFDQIHPTVIQQIVEPQGGRYRRDLFEDELRKCVTESPEENEFAREIIKKRIKENNNNIEKESESSKNKTTRTKKEELMFLPNNETFLDQNMANENLTNMTETRLINLRSNPPVNLVDKSQQAVGQSSEPLKNLANKNNFLPDYTLVFENSKETQNFREVPDKHVRKKRYVFKVVDDDDIHDQVQDVLKQKLESQYGHLTPLQDYYERVNSFLEKLYSSHQPLCQVGGDCYYYRDAPAKETYHSGKYSMESFEDYEEGEQEESFEEKPKKKKIKIKKLKPKIIIDNKGRPFMEYNGYKRPVILHRKKMGILNKGSSYLSSSEETGTKIATLITRAKEDTEIVGNIQKDMIPQQVVKERISDLLEEIDQLVHLNVEKYDDIFEGLIKIEQVKASIEQDWKRMLIDDRVNDIRAKVGLLSKFKELQHLKDISVKKIAAALMKNDNEFVRCQLIKSLIRLQKLQCLISSVVEDFEQHLKMKTAFNTKKEIKYIDYLSELKFAFARTKNDLVKALSKDRDSEGLKYVDMLHKLKKLLISCNDNPEKLEDAAKLLWELKNLEKLQIETINDMNMKLSRNFKVKKELKILFDLQKRFDDCNRELCEFLRGVEIKNGTTKVGQKKDIKEIIAEVKKKHEEMLQKAKERSSNLLVKKS